MARMARLVIPDVPHHVTQRGNGRATTFFSDDDYALYRDLLAEHCAAAGVEAWAWVLMPNPVHPVLGPSDEDGLRAALARTHRRYTGHVHARHKRTGHFRQGRFGCVVMDEAHLAAANRYVAHNRVRARLVERAEDWRWSSVHAHLGLTTDDGLTTTAPVAERFPDLAARIAAGEDEEMLRAPAPGRADRAAGGRSRLRRRPRTPDRATPDPGSSGAEAVGKAPVRGGDKCTVTRTRGSPFSVGG